MSGSGRRKLVARLTSATFTGPSCSNTAHASSRRWATSSPPARPRTAIFFPGQGVQRVGMARAWVEAFPGTANPILEEIDDTLGLSLTKIIESGTNAELNATENSQPAIMATSILILRVLEQEFGLDVEKRVDYTLGHSLGEFAALVAGGYLTFKDALIMVRKRGEVMASISKQTSAEYGGEVGMVALICEHENHLQPLIDAIHEFTALSSAGSKYDSVEDVPPVQQVVIANINSKNQIVLSGSIERIKTLLTHLRQFGGHDPRHVFMRQYLDSKSIITGEDIIAWPGKIPCISNVSARPFASREDLKEQLARQAVATVRWWDSVRYLDQEAKVRRWIGIGPGKVGRNLVGKEVGMKGKVKGGGVWGITTPLEAEECMQALDTTEAHDEEIPPEMQSVTIHSAGSSCIPAAVTEAARRSASYVLNPAIVQQLWPPSRRSSGTGLGASFHMGSHGPAMFTPASTQVSNLQQIN